MARPVKGQLILWPDGATLWAAAAAAAKLPDPPVNGETETQQACTYGDCTYGACFS